MNLVACHASCTAMMLNPLNHFLCAFNCSQQYPTAMAEDYLYRDCISKHCSAKSCPKTDAVSACSLCGSTHCESNMENCWKDTDCPSAMFCYYTHKANPSMLQSCLNDLKLSTQSKSVYDKHLNCIKQNCAASC